MASQCCEHSHFLFPGQPQNRWEHVKAREESSHSHFLQMLFKHLPAESSIRPEKTWLRPRVRSLVPHCFTRGLMRSVIDQERLALQLCDRITRAVSLSPGKGSFTPHHLTWARLCCRTQQTSHSRKEAQGLPQSCSRLALLMTVCSATNGTLGKPLTLSVPQFHRL